MILVMVLIFLAAILALVVQLQITARLGLRFEARRCLAAQLRAAAADAAWSALRVLAGDDDLRVDHTNEAWSAVMTNRLPNAIETTVRITDENRYYDVNNLSAQPTNPAVRLPFEVVRDCLAWDNRADPDGSTVILRDYVDPADGGRLAGLAADIVLPNALMESPAELAALLAAYSGSPRPPPATLTVLPDENPARIVPINVNTADPSVLLAVMGAANAGLADRICRQRALQPIVLLDQIADPLVLRALQPHLDTRSVYFSLRADAEKDGQRESVYSLVRRDLRGQVDVLRWVYR